MIYSSRERNYGPPQCLDTDPVDTLQERFFALRKMHKTHCSWRLFFFFLLVCLARSFEARILIWSLTSMDSIINYVPVSMLILRATAGTEKSKGSSRTTHNIKKMVHLDSEFKYCGPTGGDVQPSRCLDGALPLGLTSIDKSEGFAWTESKFIQSPSCFATPLQTPYMGSLQDWFAR